MQIFDRKYRLFGVINIIDLIVVIALLVGGFVVWKVLWGGSTSTVPTAKLRDIEYTVLCIQTHNYTDGQVKVGDPLSTKTSGKPIGTITAVRAVPTPGDVLNPFTGKVQPYDSTFLTDVFVTVKAKGDPTSTGVSVGDTQIRNNEILPIVTPTFQCDAGIITDLKIGGE